MKDDQMEKLLGLVLKKSTIDAEQIKGILQLFDQLEARIKAVEIALAIEKAKESEGHIDE